MELYWNILEDLTLKDVLPWGTEISYKSQRKECNIKFCHSSVLKQQAICIVTNTNVRWQWLLKSTYIPVSTAALTIADESYT